MFKLLLATYKLTKVPFLNKLWFKCYKWFTGIKKNQPLQLKLHGYKIEMPANYQYPFSCRFFKTFNNPLIECVYQSYRALERKIIFIDIGAAIGDTVLLVKSNCKDMVSKFYCIDGDDEFAVYMDKNLSRFNDVTIIKQMLSDRKEFVNSLLRIHPGTASAIGSDQVKAMSLDEVSQSYGIENVDVLKIDVDGFDGMVLNGAKDLLTRSKPIVIFEWHPKLYKQADKNIHLPFSVLAEAGYNNFVWFTKYGTFNHIAQNPSDYEVDFMNNLCLNASFDDDWHYDIVAVHKDSKVNILDIANTAFSINKCSRY